jgi:hypothetical protein
MFREAKGTSHSAWYAHVKRRHSTNEIWQARTEDVADSAKR